MAIPLTESLANLDKDAWTMVLSQYTCEWGIDLKIMELFKELNRDGKINEFFVRAVPWYKFQ